jgi:hypothetical protein
MRLQDVTDENLEELYRVLEKTPCPTNGGKSLGAKSARDMHNILSGALGSAVPDYLPSNPASLAQPPMPREIKAQQKQHPTFHDNLVD